MFSNITMKKLSGLSLFILVVTSISALGVRADSRAEAVSYPATGGYVYCDYGMDMTKKNLTGVADAQSENKWAGYRKIYRGGTWATGSEEYAEGAAYNYDGSPIDKFTFELRDRSNANSPLSCEADLYIDGGKTKYCTFQISEFCDELLFPMEDWESPALDDEKLRLFIEFGDDFVQNSKSMLAGLMRGTEAEQQGCNCGTEYRSMPDSEMIEELVMNLQDAYANGLLEVLTQEEYEGIIGVLLEEYELRLSEESQAETTATSQSGDNGADIIRIHKDEAVCRRILLDYSSGLYVTSCFYGHRADTTRYKEGNEITNIRILAFEELYLGGTYTGGAYNYDGQFFGKFRKFFKYNDNADIFWKVEVSVCASQLEFQSSRDQEYNDTSRTKYYGYGLPLSEGSPPDPDCAWWWSHLRKKYWRDYEESQ